MKRYGRPSPLNYGRPGVTQIEDLVWTGRGNRHRTYAKTLRVGAGGDAWTRAQELGTTWQLKLQSGFMVDRQQSAPVVEVGDDYVLRPKYLLLRIAEPVRVIAVMNQESRCGFAYGTRYGHPIAGEEAFIFHRAESGAVFFTHRIASGAASGWRRLLYPPALLFQIVVRRRYHHEAAGYVNRPLT
jgi:uncharacterized protein (UPF0548 family)